MSQDGRQQMIAGVSFQQYCNESLPTGWTVEACNIYAPDFVGRPAIQFKAAAFTTPLSTGIAFKVTNQSPHIVGVFMEISPPQSPARYFYKGPWMTDYNVGKEVVSLGTFTFSISNLIPGMKYFARMRAVTAGITPTHLGTVLSSPAITSSIAITNP
jgi:hypothetical protein